MGFNNGYNSGYDDASVQFERERRDLRKRIAELERRPQGVSLDNAVVNPATLVPGVLNVIAPAASVAAEFTLSIVSDYSAESMSSFEGYDVDDLQLTESDGTYYLSFPPLTRRGIHLVSGSSEYADSVNFPGLRPAYYSDEQIDVYTPRVIEITGVTGAEDTTIYVTATVDGVANQPLHIINMDGTYDYSDIDNPQVLVVYGMILDSNDSPLGDCYVDLNGAGLAGLVGKTISTGHVEYYSVAVNYVRTRKDLVPPSAAVLAGGGDIQVVAVVPERKSGEPAFGLTGAYTGSIGGGTHLLTLSPDGNGGYSRAERSTVQ